MAIAFVVLMFSGCFTTFSERCDVNGKIAPEGVISSVRTMSGNTITFDTMGARVVEVNKDGKTRKLISPFNPQQEALAIPVDSVLEAHATWDVFSLLQGNDTTNHFITYDHGYQGSGFREMGDHATLKWKDGHMHSGFVRSVVDDTMQVFSNDTTVNVAVADLASVELQPQPFRSNLLQSQWFVTAEMLGILWGNAVGQLPNVAFPGTSYLQFEGNHVGWATGVMITCALAAVVSALLPSRIDWPAESLSSPAPGASPEDATAFRFRIADAAPGGAQDRMRLTFSLHELMFVSTFGNAKLSRNGSGLSFQPNKNAFDSWGMPIDLAHVAMLTQGILRHVELGVAAVNLGEPELFAQNAGTTVSQHLFGAGAAALVRVHASASGAIGFGCAAGLAHVGFDRTWTNQQLQGADHVAANVPFLYLTADGGVPINKYLRISSCVDYTITAPIDIPDNQLLHISGRSLNLGNFSFGFSLGWKFN